MFDEVLPMALNAWMQGMELERPVHTWFDNKSLRTKEDPRRIERAIIGGPPTPKGQSTIVWLGTQPLETDDGIMVFSDTAQRLIRCNPSEKEWILTVCDKSPSKPRTFHKIQQTFPNKEKRFWKIWSQLNVLGLMAV
jgi:hypothetical protein